MRDQARDGERRQQAFKPWLQYLLSCRILGIALTASGISCKVGLLLIPSPPTSRGAGRLAGLSV